MKNFLYIFLILLSSFVLSFLFLNKKDKFENNFQNYETRKIKINNIELEAYISDNEEKRILGLSNSKKLEKNESMLFVFQKPEIQKFWMKNMNYSIDILFFNESKELVFIKENASPSSFPESFGPNENILYVLETNSFFTSKNNIKIGNRFEFLD